MSRGRFPGFYGFAQVVARTLGWMTAVATIVVLAFIVNRWPDKGGAIAAGIVGAAIALLNDSWQIAATVDRSLGFPRMSPARALLHDIFSLAICLGGIVMVIFSRYTYDIGEFASLASDSKSRNRIGSKNDNVSRDGFSLRRMLAEAAWILTAIVIWRFIFIVWGCIDCFKQYRTVRIRVHQGMIRVAQPY